MYLLITLITRTFLHALLSCSAVFYYLKHDGRHFQCDSYSGGSVTAIKSGAVLGTKVNVTLYLTYSKQIIVHSSLLIISIDLSCYTTVVTRRRLLSIVFKTSAIPQALLIRFLFSCGVGKVSVSKWAIS